MSRRVPDEGKLGAFIAALEDAKSGSAVKFFNNLDNLDVMLSYIDDDYPYSYLVGNAFAWSGSSEGRGYWEEIERGLRL